MHPYNRRQVRNNRETFVIIVMAYYSLNLLLMKKKSYLMFAGIIALLLCWSSAMMAQNNSQRESTLRNALSARQGGMAMGSTLKNACCSAFKYRQHAIADSGFTPAKASCCASLKDSRRHCTVGKRHSSRRLEGG